jgi:hypothetical protein
MMSVFALSASPFSKSKFAGYLVGVAAIAGLSFVHFGPLAPEPVALTRDGAGAEGALFELQRFGRPADELRDRLPGIGIPWFLRRAGVLGQVDLRDPAQVVITLAWGGKIVGRYIERTQPIDADRTRLYVAFEANDMALVRRLAAPIDTTLDPPSLLRVTMAEHVRASIDGDGFRLSVLKPDAPRYKLDALFGALTPQPSRDTDNFALGDADREDAAIRQAYRDEAKRAGAAAPTL